MHVGSSIVRRCDADGRDGTVRLTGPLAAADAVPVDFLEEPGEAGRSRQGQPGAGRIELPPWRIQAVRLGRADGVETVAAQKGRNRS